MKSNNVNHQLAKNEKNTRKYLGVNIDHVATLRQARGTSYPSVVQAALVAEMAGADQITLHLREDRRHIQDKDVWQLREQIQTRMNFEMAVTDFMVDFAKKVKPEICCLVPEKREELTTEGGLDVKGHFEAVKAATHALMDAEMDVSLFIDADFAQIDAAFETGANAIEIHTGAYADAKGKAQEAELDKIIKGVAYAHEKGLIVNVGHGLHYHNILPVAAIPNVVEYNIGHAIIARAIFVGLDAAVREIKAALS